MKNNHYVFPSEGLIKGSLNTLRLLARERKRTLHCWQRHAPTVVTVCVRQSLNEEHCGTMPSVMRISETNAHH